MAIRRVGCRRPTRGATAARLRPRVSDRPRRQTPRHLGRPEGHRHPRRRDPLPRPTHPGRDRPLPPAEQPDVAPQSGSPSQTSFNIGDEFHAECVVPRPTAHSYGIDSATLSMTCDGVPLSQYLFTHVQYGNPDIRVTPTNSTMIVPGQIVDIIQSGWGYSTLEVVADNIDCCTASF